LSKLEPAVTPERNLQPELTPQELQNNASDKNIHRPFQSDVSGKLSKNSRFWLLEPKVAKIRVVYRGKKLVILLVCRRQIYR